MHFLIADTFTDSLARLTGDEQKAVKTTAFEMQMTMAGPGLSVHRLDHARDKRFWSARVNQDLRIIFHQQDDSVLLCYVDHHDRAYAWAERRRLETHPATGAAQLVEIRETVKEVVVPVYVPTEVSVPEPTVSPDRPVFQGVSDRVLLGYGVPADWLDDVRKATAANLLGLADHLPAEAAEALLELATGGTPRPAAVPAPSADPFAHPDAMRRFRTMANVDELARALEYPWEKWTVFLHPEQRQWVERDYAGPARVSGSAGTGKTVVALHRAVHLARRNPSARVLLTTFSEALAHALHTKLKRLLGNEPRLAERIDVHALPTLGLRLHRAQVGPVRLATRADIDAALSDAARDAKASAFTPHFLRAEWDDVVDAWQLEDWPGYRDVARLGRKTRLTEAQRKALWSIFERTGGALDAKGLRTEAGVFTGLARAIGTARNPPFDFAIVDESQDLTIAHLRFLAALAGVRPNALFFAGDLGQRIFQAPFSWKSVGVDIRGRARTLRVNYRTSHQIRAQTDRLLGASLTDVDGNREDRRDTISVFNGPPPTVLACPDERAEIAAVATWLAARTKEGLLPHEFGVFVRTEALVARARSAIAAAGMEATVLDEHVETASGRVSVGTLHLAKGLEFRNPIRETVALAS